MKTKKKSNKLIRGDFWGDLLLILLFSLILLPMHPILAQDNTSSIQNTSVDNSNFPEIVLTYKGFNL